VRRRHAPGFKAPKNLTHRPSQREQPEQRLCLMSAAGRCSLSFVALGQDDRLMCSNHWQHVSDELREQLRAGADEYKAALLKWHGTQRAAVQSVIDATRVVD